MLHTQNRQNNKSMMYRYISKVFFTFPLYWVFGHFLEEYSENI